MRIRNTTTNSDVWETQGYRDIEDPFIMKVYGPYTYGPFIARSEVIQDEGANPRRENFCSHDKRINALIGHELIPMRRLVSPHSNIRRLVYANCGTVQMASEFLGHAAVAIPGVPASFDSDALSIAQNMWQSIRPTMSSDFSLVNFVLELRDMVQLMDLYKELQRKWKVRKDLSKTYRREHSHRIDALASSAVLQYNFGLAPFLADVMTLFSALSTFNRRLSALIKGENKIHRRHVRWHMDQNIPVDQRNLSATMQTAMPGAVYHRTWSRQPALVSGTFVYNYTLPDADGLRLKSSALLSTLGLNVDPSILWNAIPFSFVIDWVFDVGGWLRSLSVESLGVFVNLVSCSVSCKVQNQCSYDLEWPQASWRNTLCVAKREGYRRVVLDPIQVVGAQLPQFRLPSGAAITNAAALGHQLSGAGQRPAPRNTRVGRVPLLLR